MFGGLAFMVGDHMCLGIIGDELIVRVSKDADAGALAQPHTRPMDFTGKPMRGMVCVQTAGFSDDAALESWVRRGLDFVATLPAR